MGLTIHVGWRTKKKPAKKAGKPRVGKGMTIEWVDRPSRNPDPVWHVFADEHDGNGFQPTGRTHTGDPGDFNPYGRW